MDSCPGCSKKQMSGEGRVAEEFSSGNFDLRPPASFEKAPPYFVSIHIFSRSTNYSGALLGSLLNIKVPL